MAKQSEADIVEQNDTANGDFSVGKLLFCAVGIYCSFLTWALVQEPLNTIHWPQSNEQFKSPNIIAISQAFVAMVIGFVYLSYKSNVTLVQLYHLIWNNKKYFVIISVTQALSAPIASYSLQHVDYLTFMLAKSCKIIPILMVHMLLYRTTIANEKKIVAVLVTLGVMVFTLGSKKTGPTMKVPDELEENMILTHFYGYSMLLLSLFLDGLTNATQDKMLKLNKNSKKHELISGAHLMFALNLFIVIWNTLYLILVDRNQFKNALTLIEHDPIIIKYLTTYSCCGAIGQIFIFYTLEYFGSIILVMITVTRKMMSMLLSIAVYKKSVNLIQWAGISIVFGGIIWEALHKTKKVIGNKTDNDDKKIL
ncbi:hypothetical protein TPHA_0D03560 [Tetrapisispora phaffii CBS 4417]|uniref:UDP-galactose transporter homolog 1 n=1 Tax=Tetrapisispora phaffii (strain ATCC 24235 / CBS 4417 / NBRC 1672 / NRRL Y-8282 / UCD 70-5) TaxID=1071381 RepID=G8BT20_TETPH|nr:hypothetical protein TPHA_0D03560 [Tetrapisispora phaffii CBS 4417]CCE62991.1 hypothetical protein TPHA_0D03560 [Tetrapisispora phaffii CBS 4417]